MNPLRRYAYSNIWNVGFIEQPLDEFLGDAKRQPKINWLKHSCKDRWFADPFILDVNAQSIEVLVEEYYYPIHRGRIALLIIDRHTYQLKESLPVLELDTHLSFPAILRKDGKVYIYPENSASGRLTLYEFDRTQLKCTPCETLCEAPLTDAIMTSLMGEDSLIYSTCLPEPNKNVLGAYTKTGLRTQYLFDSNIARNAGDWFEWGGKLYRPAQDCNHTYGGAVIIQRVHRGDGGELKFTDVRRIEPSHPVLSEGCHTFNHYNGLTVVDGKGPHHKLARSLYGALIKLKNGK